MYSNDFNDDGSFENGSSSPISAQSGAVSGRNNALSNKLTGVLSWSHADPEIRDTLSILDARGAVNDARTRRGLRLEAQREIIECNGEIVQDFGLVSEVRFMQSWPYNLAVLTIG